LQINILNTIGTIWNCHICTCITLY